MKTVNISKKAYASLESMDIPKEVTNSEAQMKYIVTKKGREVFKSLYYLEGEKFGSKLYILEMLNSYRDILPESMCIPDSLVSVHGKIKGFTVPFCEGTNLTMLLRDSNVPIDVRLQALKKVGYILDSLSLMRKYSPLKDFYINDLHSGNIIYNPHNDTMKIIDLDSAKIANSSVYPAKHLTPFSLFNKMEDKKFTRLEENPCGGFVKPDEQTDLYCYYMMILNFLFGDNINNISKDDYYIYISYLKRIGVSSDLIYCFDHLFNYTDSENPVGLLDSLTSEQIYRAKRNVFELVSRKHSF